MNATFSTSGNEGELLQEPSASGRMTPPLLSLSGITKSFGVIRALKGVSFDLFPGEVHALVGENGAGKTTLIKVITGAHQPDSGAIQINGASIVRLRPASAHSFGIAAIYQQPALFPDLSVMENIAMPLEKPTPARLIRWNERRNQAVDLLKRVGADIGPETEVRQLSMPQQQLVEIARALGAGARILLMDEPTASLTNREVDLLFALIKDLRSKGVAIIYISHRLSEIFQIADRVTVLRDGETVGTRPVQISGPSHNTLTQPELIQLMVGREVSALFPPSQNKPGEKMFSVKNLNCRSTGTRDVSFDISAGEILGLAGLVGAGRTELAHILFGITRADSGTIQLKGKPLQIHSPRDAVEAGIAYVPEDRRRHGVILEMPIAANITMAILSRLFPASWMKFRAERELAQNFIRDLSIKAPSPETRAGALSGGNQQKVALARWLAASPNLLILDEPTQGVDVGAKAEIHKLIRQLAVQGMAVLMISSELPEILGMSDRVAVMRAGTITAVFDRDKADARSVMAAALGR
jgi:rhamnose transport system ATP-binding protein